LYNKSHFFNELGGSPFFPRQPVHLEGFHRFPGRVVAVAHPDESVRIACSHENAAGGLDVAPIEQLVSLAVQRGFLVQSHVAARVVRGLYESDIAKAIKNARFHLLVYCNVNLNIKDVDKNINVII
jgi:hypothetical protein